MHIYIYIYIYICIHYVDTNKIIVYVKTEHSYVDFGKNVEIHVT